MGHGLVGVRRTLHRLDGGAQARERVGGRALCQRHPQCELLEGVAEAEELVDVPRRQVDDVNARRGRCSTSPCSPSSRSASRSGRGSVPNRPVSCSSISRSPGAASRSGSRAQLPDEQLDEVCGTEVLLASSAMLEPPVVAPRGGPPVRRSGTALRVVGSVPSTEEIEVQQARAVVYRRTGGPEVLELAGRGVPEPGPGEVRVRSTARGSTPPTGSRARATAAARPWSRHRCPGRTAPGWSTRSARASRPPGTGVRVWVWEAAYRRPEGTAQDYALVPARQAVLLPDSASFDLGRPSGSRS